MVEHAEPKPSYNIIVIGSTSRLRTVFDPALVFAHGSCHFETYYSFPDINDANNSVNISIDKGVTWNSIKIPIGCYEIKVLNDVLQRLIVDVASGKGEKMVHSPNNNTLKCILDIKDTSYQIDFTVENSLRTVLGFDSRIYKYGYESENLVVIMSVNSISVHCDIIGVSRVYGIEVPVIYNFIPNAARGDKIVWTPRNLIYVPITLNVISHMTCWLTDQNGNELDLRGEELTITFYMKAC